MNCSKLEKGCIIGNFTFVENYNSNKHRCLLGLWQCNFCNKQYIKKNCTIKKIKTCSLECRRNQAINSDKCWNILIKKLHCRCKTINKRNRIFVDCNITPKYLKELYLNQNGKCFYTKQDIYPPFSVKNKTENKYCISIDRIDSNKGYIKENIQLVTKTVNFMKQSLSNTKFIELCNIISKRF